MADSRCTRSWSRSTLREGFEIIERGLDVTDADFEG
jgi:hypothetical protein